MHHGHSRRADELDQHIAVRDRVDAVSGDTPEF